MVHANSAISSALRNDSTLALTVNRLRNLDFVSNNLTLEQGIHELDRLAGELHDDSVHGDGEVKRLRDMADKSTDPTRKAELHAFADALGGALARQKKVAMDLNGLVAYMQYREMATPDETEAKFAAADSNDTAFQNAPFRPAFMGGGQRREPERDRRQRRRRLHGAHAPDRGGRGKGLRPRRGGRHRLLILGPSGRRNRPAGTAAPSFVVVHPAVRTVD